MPGLKVQLGQGREASEISLSITTGACISESLQLSEWDIRKDADIWGIDINYKDGKTIRNISRRGGLPWECWRIILASDLKDAAVALDIAQSLFGHAWERLHSTVMGPTRLIRWD